MFVQHESLSQMAREREQINQTRMQMVKLKILIKPKS